MSFKSVSIIISVSAVFLLSCDHSGTGQKPIDRFTLVTRHNVLLTSADTLGSLTVGNGEFAFTVDASGLQTFYKEYENGIPLGTQSQWAWHSNPASHQYKLKDVNVSYESCDGTAAPYAVQHPTGRAGEATQALRANPHRLHLGLIGLQLIKENGEEASLSDLKKIRQELDLWTGRIESTYEIEGIPVRVILYAHQKEDQIAVSIESPLITKKRLKVSFNFPYGQECHVCPGYDWMSSEKHHSNLIPIDGNTAVIKRQLDSTQYYTTIAWTSGKLSPSGEHAFGLQPDVANQKVAFSVLFHPQRENTVSNFSDTEKNSIESWKTFWTTGAAIDFSACTDVRAKELERRVILSQYLTKVQCAGSSPPQETGLTMNSWYGKFHMEMYWWHGAHFPLWGRDNLLEKSMGWYQQVLPKAQTTASLQGYKGARWQKMTDPYGNESPSGVGSFIIWQQPHPIYLAELLYRQHPDKRLLEKYQAIVFNTADFMVSFLKTKDGKYHLCHPLIPAQEIFKAGETDDPTFELQYWYYTLTVAQQWRARLGLEKNTSWEDALTSLAPLPVRDGFYLPNSTTPDAYTDEQYRHDHPSVLGAYGMLPWNERVDTTVMLKTFTEIFHQWNWESTWGWDYPLMAMTATRLNKPEMAIAVLLMETQKNTYLVNGHNYQDKRLRLYLPGNGGLLIAVAMMAAGWDGCAKLNPGFPDDGKWNVRWEGLHPLP